MDNGRVNGVLIQRKAKGFMVFQIVPNSSKNCYPFCFGDFP